MYVPTKIRVGECLESFLLVDLSIFCLANFSTLHFCDRLATIFNVDAKRFKKSNDDFLYEPTLLDGYNSTYNLLRNSHKVSYSGLNKVSWMIEL